ncbi:MAG: NOB1 family endonuclease, partial [Candidatus Hodarchaeota archaeon]
MNNDNLKKKKRKSFILDASAIINARQLERYLNIGRLFITESVLSELQDRMSSFHFDILKESGYLSVVVPSLDSIKKIEEIVRNAGSLKRLSNTDIDVLGLILDLEEENPIIISDDHEIQNIAALLGFSYEPSPNGKKIKSTIIWKFICLSCNHSFSNETDFCPDCGGSIKRIVKYNPKFLVIALGLDTAREDP